MTVHGPERRGPERPGPDYPAEWDREPEEVLPGHRYDVDTRHCICGALDHPEWGCSA